MRYLPTLATVLIGLVGANAVLAQATVPADPPPAGTPEVVPEKIEPNRPIGPPPPGSPAQAESLSDELSRTDGVIKPPPAVDPEMVEPPPDGGSARTPVIPAARTRVTS